MQNATLPLRRLAMLSVHTCPLAALGGKKTGGMNVYVREISREFGRRGIQVDVFTRNQESCQSHIGQQIGDNARVIHIPAGPLAMLDPDQIYPYVREFTRNTIDFAASEHLHYDLIYSHYWLSGVAAHELRTAWNVPVVQMFHTLGMMKERIANQPADRPISARDVVEMDIMRWADRLIAATPAERAQMLWLYRANRRQIEIVPPGVDVTRFCPIPTEIAKQSIGLRPEQKMLLFVGRIEPLKGVDTIFEALALIKRDAPQLVENLTLSIIGGDPSEAQGSNAEMDRLKSLRTELGLHDLVMFLGAKEQELLNTYYAASEALIMPSDYESFGMVALEAMASGTPVIASEVGGLAYLVQDGITGYHVPVREPAVLAEKIRIILEQPRKRKQLGRNANTYAQEYSWPRIADRLLDVFAEAIPARQGATAGK